MHAKMYRHTPSHERKEERREEKRALRRPAEENRTKTPPWQMKKKRKLINRLTHTGDGTRYSIHYHYYYYY
jgi:hypothetical protein